MGNERLKSIRNTLKLSQKAFGKELGLAQQTYANYESGVASIPDSIKEQLANKYNINLNWLICGNSNMYTNSYYETEDVSPDFVSEARENKYLFRSCKGREVAISNDENVEVTVYKQLVSAGNGEDWVSEVGSSYVVKLSKDFIKNYKEVYGAVVRGDSMQDIYLYNNDVVFFSKKIKSGDGIYVLTIDNELFVKRLEFEPISRMLRIISYNENFKTQEISADDDRVVILGKVIGWLHGV